MPLPLPQMPMKTAADEAAGAPPLDLPPLSAPPGAMPPAMPPPPMMPPAAAPMPAMPPPMPAAPMLPQFGPEHVQTRTQDDGTVVGFIPLPDGSEHIIGVMPPFKLPKPQKKEGQGQGQPMPDMSRAALPPMQ